MKLNRTLSLCLTLVICAGLAIGGTLAYYTDQATVTNTFNLSEGVDITLDEAVVEKNGDNWEATDERTEAGNTYDGIYPGAVLPKDPTVTVSDNSDDAYVRVKVTVENGFNFMGVYTDGAWDPEGFFHLLTNNTLGEGWTLTDINILMSGPDRDTSDLEYTLTYDKRLSKNEKTTPAFTEIVFSPKFDQNSIATMVGKGFEVNVVAEAIQAATFNSAVDAFAHYDGTALGAADTSWYTADATEYTLNSAEDLLGFAQLVNGGNAFNGKTVKLGDDIDLQNADWEPIGQTGKTTFNGVFDGQNHTISNLYIDSEAETGAHYSSGLFGWVETHSEGKGIIKNVTIDGATVKGHHNVGALVGYITETHAVVENCHVKNAKISCTYANGDADGDKAGALIGMATVATTVKDCSATDCTVSSGRDAGQLIGAGKEANVTGCTATNVTVEANGTGTGNNIRNEIIGRAL